MTNLSPELCAIARHDCMPEGIEDSTVFFLATRRLEVQNLLEENAMLRSRLSALEAKVHQRTINCGEPNS